MKKKIDMEQAAEQLLETYMQFRDNLPHDGYVEEHKTTLEIQDDLAPMLYVSEEKIVKFMLSHDYNMTTEADGTVRWAIWRMLGT